MARPRKSEGLTIDWAEKGAYPVRVVDRLFDTENPAVIETLREVTGQENPRVMLVADANVVQRTDNLGTRIGKYVQTHGITLVGAPVVLGGGEKIKADNFQSVMRVVTAALEGKLGRADVLMALGGGSLLDVAGFAASQIRGGVKLVRVPTTTAAMVDAVFADMAAADSANVKDVLRIPSRPAAVLIDPAFARTVLDGVWRGGIGEMIRQAAVLDSALMKKIAKNAELLKTRDLALLGEIVRDCVAVRVKKGGTDFALWSAHRLEAMSGYKLPHGYAVPIAVCIDCAYAVEKGILKESDQELICGSLAACGALDGLAHSHHLLSQADTILYGLDSWRLGTGAESIPLPSGVGKATVEDQPDREIFKKVIKEFLAVSSAS